MLSENSVRKIHGTYRIPCTTGGSMGIGGVFVSAFKEQFIITLDAGSTEPNDDELLMLQSHREFTVKKWYRNPDKILQMEFPAVQGHNTIVFMKGGWWSSNGKNGWAFRRMTWEIGPAFFPPSDISEPAPPPWNLLQVLDYIEKLVPKEWIKWKSEHKELFRETSE